MKKELFFGTNNAHKLREISEILGEKYTILSFRDVAPIEVEETEDTIAGNAILKAKAFFAHTGLACFADDTGLEVEALGGAPGVYSARYAGEEGNAEANMNLLLQNLVDKTNRSARFLTVIAFYDGENITLFEGVLEGEILKEKRGTNGFGYDPIFLPKNAEQTLAEMSSEQKHGISHRGKAVAALAHFLAKLG